MRPGKGPLLVTDAEAALLRRVMHHRIVGPDVRSDTIDLTVISGERRKKGRAAVAGGDGGGAAVVVKLTKVSGSAGGPSTAASWAYDGWLPANYDDSGSKLFTALQPKYRPTLYGYYTNAAAGSYGYAYYDETLETPAWVLLQALDEKLSTDPCDCSAT